MRVRFAPLYLVGGFHLETCFGHRLNKLLDTCLFRIINHLGLTFLPIHISFANTINLYEGATDRIATGGSGHSLNLNEKSFSAFLCNNRRKSRKN